MKRAEAKNGRRLGLGRSEEATQKLEKEEDFVVKLDSSISSCVVEGRANFRRVMVSDLIVSESSTSATFKCQNSISKC